MGLFLVGEVEVLEGGVTMGESAVGVINFHKVVILEEGSIFLRENFLGEIVEVEAKVVEVADHGACFVLQIAFFAFLFAKNCYCIIED